MAKEEIHRIPYNPPDAESFDWIPSATESGGAPTLSLRFARLRVVFLDLANDEGAKHTIGLLMISRYAGGAKGAREAARAGAAVVVVDAFRASATICVLASKGARIVPLASVEEAKVFPADFRIGERGGAKVAGFDFGNSPTALRAAELSPNSTVAMTTTNGTRLGRRRRLARNTRRLLRQRLGRRRVDRGFRLRRGCGRRVRMAGATRLRGRGRRSSDTRTSP